MESTKEDPLDEIVWRAPEAVQELGGIHTNTVLYYFARSPFFDATSNNNVVFTQAMNNQSLFHVITTRAHFEERLRSMQGLEFMVTQDPSEGDKKQIHSGVWVVRKQNRRKRAGMQDEVTPISAYYIVGENVYMAPSLGSVLSSRLLSTLTSLSSFLSTARLLPDFTPALGHTYLPPASKHTTPSSSFQATQVSKDGTPVPSGSPLPDTQDTSSTKGSFTQKANGETQYQDARLFAEAWDLSIRYGNDYMDENPLVGEPGNFKLSKSIDLSLSTSMSSSASAPQPFRAVTKKPPAPLKTDLPAEKEKKGASATAKSPITPSSGLKDKKGRRKSKAAGVATPKAETPKPVTPG